MTIPQRANLRQIAKSLGLSVTTVSRALKDGPEVRAATRARVKAAAEALGYFPNMQGRALKTGRTSVLAAILPLETSSYLADLAKLPLIEGMTIAAQAQGFSLSISSTAPGDDALSSLQAVIQTGIADGVIITRMVHDDPRIDYLLDRGFPFVSFGRSTSERAHAFVDIDNERICAEATMLLAKDGHKRIALQNLSRHDQLSRARIEGYRSALSEANLPFDPDLIGVEDFTMQASELSLDRMLQLAEPPTALICANELGVLGALSALRKHDLAPGTDVALFVRDNTQMFRYLSLPIRTHTVDMAQVGTFLIDALVARIAQPTVPPRQTLLRGHYTAHDQTAAFGGA